MSGERLSTEIDETARLVLMDWPSGPAAFARILREYHPEASTRTILTLWGRYRGNDGRSLPTHDYRTGERITPSGAQS